MPLSMYGLAEIVKLQPSSDPIVGKGDRKRGAHCLPTRGTKFQMISISKLTIPFIIAGETLRRGEESE